MTNSPFEALDMYVRHGRSIHVHLMQLERRHKTYWPVRLGRVRVVYTGFSEAEEHNTKADSSTLQIESIRFWYTDCSRIPSCHCELFCLASD
jgi:hypothetical protein